MGKSSKIEVSKVTIKIGDQETPLTVEQARELRDALTALLGGDTKVIERIIERDRWHGPWWVYMSDPIPNVITTSGTWTNSNTGNFTLSLNNVN